MSLASDMASIDAQMLDDLGDNVRFNGTVVRTIFMTGPRVVTGGENVVEVLQHEGWCRKAALPVLVVGDPVEVLDDEDNVVGTYTFLAQDPPDEAGFCRVVLGST